MKKILFITILLSIFAYPQDYKLRDTVDITKNHLDDVRRSHTGSILNIYEILNQYLYRTSQLEQEQLKNVNVAGTLGHVLGFGENDPNDQPRDYPIDYFLQFSQELLNIKARLEALESGTPPAPIYTFNYSPSLYFGDTKEIGQDSSKIVYIKNTGTATLKVTSLTYELVGGEDVVFTHTLKNHTSGANQDTVSVGDSVKLTITYTPTTNSIGYLDEWKLIVTSNGGTNDTLFLSGAGKATPIAADSWQNVGIGAGGWFRSIKYHTQNRSIVYMIGDLSGFYKSTDGGSTWNPKNNGLTNFRGEDIAVHPTNGNTLVLATDGGIFRSTDAAETWELVGEEVTGIPSLTSTNETLHYNCAISAVHISDANPNYWYAGTGGYGTHSHWSGSKKQFMWKLYRSTNNGVSWDTANAGTSYNSIRINNSIISITTNPSNPNAVWVSTQNVLLKSYNRGLSYLKIDEQAESNYKLTYGGYTYKGAWCAAIDPKDTSRVFAALFNTESEESKIFNNIRLSTDGGATWVTANNSTVGGIAEEIKFDKANPNKLYAGWRKRSTNQFFVSDNNGDLWISKGLLSSTIDAGWYSFEPVTSFDVYNDTLIYCANMIARSFNTEATNMGLQQCYTVGSSVNGWTGRGAEIKVLHNTVFHPSNRSIFYQLTDDGQMLKTTDKGNSWLQQTNMNFLKVGTDPLNSTKGLAISEDNPLVMWAAQERWQRSAGTIIKTTDGGATWAASNIGLPSATDDVTPLDICWVKDNILLTNINGKGIYRTTNGGTSWYRPIALNLGFGDDEPGRGVSSLRTNFFEVDRTNRDIVYCQITQPYYDASNNYRGMWKSTNAGYSWTRYDTVDVKGVSDIAIHPDSNNVIWISQMDAAWTASSGVGGLWKSTNGGVDFTRKYYPGTAPLYFTGVAFDSTDGIMYATGFHNEDTKSIWSGRGVYRSTDYGETWAEYNEGLGGYHQIFRIKTAPHLNSEVWLGTPGHSAWRLIRKD